jgi:hypothetical protein
MGKIKGIIKDSGKSENLEVMCRSVSLLDDIYKSFTHLDKFGFKDHITSSTSII